MKIKSQKAREVIEFVKSNLSIVKDDRKLAKDDVTLNDIIENTKENYKKVAELIEEITEVCEHRK